MSLTYALVNSSRGYTKAELREIVDDYQGLGADSFNRKFDRDKEDLRAMGIPIEKVKTPGYVGDDNADPRYHILPESYRLPEVSFTAEEAGALALAGRLWKDAGLGSAAARATSRMAENATGTGVGFTDYEPRLHTSDPGFSDVLRAAWDKKPIRFRYRDAHGVDSERTVEPWGLGTRFGHWYLVGLDQAAAAQRMFRLSRIRGTVAQRPGTYDRPQDFSMANALSVLDPEAACQRAAIELSRGHGWALRAQAAEIEEGDTVDRLAVDYYDVESFSAEVSALGSHAKVLEPASLARSVAERLAAARAAHDVPIPVLQLKAGHFVGRAPATDAVARALDIISFVVARGAPTLEETAAHFGLSRRKLEAELQMIMMCGVPNGMHDQLMDVDFGSGTITISNAEALAAPMRLNLLETTSLLVGLETLLQVPGLAHAESAISAMAKLRTAAGDFADVSNVLAAFLDSAEADPHRDAVRAAITGRRLLSIDYYTASRDEKSTRIIEPLRIIEDDSRTYVRAWCRTARQLRSFRLDRVLKLTVLDEGFEIVPERHGDDESRLFTPQPEDQVAVLGFSQRLRSLVAEFAPERQGTVADETLAEVQITGTAALAGMIAHYGGELRVLAPESLRAEVIDWLDRAQGTSKQNRS
ncbi:helix-turn-helix transcriptional regulator [Paeniglutamicibacter cryotolerans]|uniref:Proteasome accessory factor C n=1 Tax=Paeniglutamicibacter cryotolerans TaxID=670079 RepID=A0A839QNR6_9MICC|nr:WYL domain-containing protein [Paeniglutamicibacter cryotolerans]MBB2997243.1 proteasome accessory factor C [Paeniglutamicibacter cryotolerans]